MLLLPAQLHRQAPQRGTAARPRQSLYQPTGWTSPSPGVTMLLARTAGAEAGRAGAGWAAGATGAAAAPAPLAASGRGARGRWCPPGGLSAGSPALAPP